MRGPALIGAGILLLLWLGCARQHGDWSTLETTVARQMPELFEAEGVQVTRFAVLGALTVADRCYQMIEVNAVLTGMLAPRGQYWFVIVAADGSVAARWHLTGDLRPLWSEGSKVYLQGHRHFPGAVVDPRILAVIEEDRLPVGNVLDFRDGFERPMLTRETRYGSSGGTADDVWQSRTAGDIVAE